MLGGMESRKCIKIVLLKTASWKWSVEFSTWNECMKGECTIVSTWALFIVRNQTRGGKIQGWSVIVDAIEDREENIKMLKCVNDALI